MGRRHDALSRPAAKRELAVAEERWLELEGKREALEAAGRESAS